MLKSLAVNFIYNRLFKKNKEKRLNEWQFRRLKKKLIKNINEILESGSGTFIQFLDSLEEQFSAEAKDLSRNSGFLFMYFCLIYIYRRKIKSS